MRVAALGLIVGLLGCGVGDSVRSVRVERRDLAMEIEINGRLEAEVNVNVGPPAVGRMFEFKIARMVQEGTLVEAGTPVIEFETKELEEQLRNARTDRDKAIKTLEKRETDLKVDSEKEFLAQAEAAARLRQASMKAAAPPEVSAGQELELARIDLKVAEAEIEYRLQRVESVARRAESEKATLRAQVERASARAQELERSIEAMRVLAPSSGMVLYQNSRMVVFRGGRRMGGMQKKKVGDRVWRMESVLQIPDLSTLRARAEIDEVHAGYVRIGQTVRLRLDADPDQTYSATIARIDSSLRRRSRADPRKVFELVLELAETDVERMRPGMRFQGDVELSRLENVVAVPLDAVQRDEGGFFFWRRTVLGQRKSRAELGKRYGDWVEVRSGLAAGDIVLVGVGE